MSWTFSITKEVGESASPMSLREAVTDEGDFEAMQELIDLKSSS
jgi:hypothetical protein